MNGVGRCKLGGHRACVCVCVMTAKDTEPEFRGEELVDYIGPGVFNCAGPEYLHA